MLVHESILIFTSLQITANRDAQLSQSQINFQQAETASNRVLNISFSIMLEEKLLIIRLH